MQDFAIHNLFWENNQQFFDSDPHLRALKALKFQHSHSWWKNLKTNEPGIYILTGGRQVGKSTSCKMLIKNYLEQEQLLRKNIFYFPCDEIYDAKELSQICRRFLEQTEDQQFLLVIDEITFVNNWDRAIKAIADEGWFTKGSCILTGSDCLILQEASMRFPGRRGTATQTDFHIYPLSFSEYVNLIAPDNNQTKLKQLFQNYLICGGYLRAINDLASYGEVTVATHQTYEQWIRGDFLKHNKKEDYLLAVLHALFTVGVSQISYSSLTQKIGSISKETCIDYCKLLERMDVLINLQSLDLNKKQGSPNKARKFHFFDPFIQNTIYQWLLREGYLNRMQFENQAVEACVASHSKRQHKTFYFKGQGEVDVVELHNKEPLAIEVKWAEQIRPNDLKTIKLFKNNYILTKNPHLAPIDNIKTQTVYEFLLARSKSSPYFTPLHPNHNS